MSILGIHFIANEHPHKQMNQFSSQRNLNGNKVRVSVEWVYFVKRDPSILPCLSGWDEVFVFSIAPGYFLTLPLSLPPTTHSTKEKGEIRIQLIISCYLALLFPGQE